MAADIPGAADQAQLFAQLDLYPWGEDAEFQVRILRRLPRASF